MTKTEKLIVTETYLKERGLDLNAFYCITIYDYEVKLQGSFSSNIAMKLSDSKLVITEAGYLQGEIDLPIFKDDEVAGERFRVEITLT